MLPVKKSIFDALHTKDVLYCTLIPLSVKDGFI